MRSVLAALLIGLSAWATAQLRPTEARALDDAMTLANLRPGDLGGVMPPSNAKAAHVALLSDPIAGLGQLTALHEGTSGDEISILRRALGICGANAVRSSKGEVADLPPSVPAAFRRPIGLLVAALASANDEIRGALVRLSPGERRTLIETLPRLAVDDPSMPLDYAKGKPVAFADVRRLLELVDVSRIEAASVTLATVVRETLPVLRAIPKRPMSPIVFKVRNVTVELAGSGPDLHLRKDVGLCVDLGGDDRYVGRYGAGIGYASVMIDLVGNDRYFGPDANYGVGIMGIGLVVDPAGDDVYGVRSVGLGCGLAGVGMLVDETGDDRYRVVSLGLGSGVRGIGIVDDRLGDDAYDVGRSGEGFGHLGGLGWTIDAAGDDVYRGGEMVQGAGRETGWGLLSDLGGNDTYRATTGQGEAVAGVGSLGDFKGNDAYLADGRAQGFSMEGGFAALIEGEGNDSYVLRRGPGQAAAFNGVALLEDREGDDLYGGTDGTPAMASEGGVALLLEAEGNDRYLSSSAFRRDGEGVALWVDGAGRDQWGDGLRDAQAEAGQGGTLLDRFGASEVPLTTNALPVPGSIPMPPPAEFAQLRQRATDGPNRGEAISRLVGIGVPALEALAANPDELFVNVASRLGTLAASTVTRLAQGADSRAARLALATVGMVPVSPATLQSALERHELALDAARAAGKARERSVVPTLSKMALANDPLTVRTAVEALAAIGDPQAAGVGSSLIDAEVLAIRRAAFRLVLTQSETAYATATRLVGANEGYRRRIGLALLGELGTPQAIAAIAPSLQGPPEAKIGALLALNGRVPTALIAVVEALRQDPDPLVRAVAERTDVGP